MRVVQISSDVLPVPPRYGGAIETYIWNISKTLSAMGVEVHILSINTDVKESSIIINDNIYLHTYHLRGVAKILTVPVANVYKNVTYLTFKLNKMLLDIAKTYGSIDVIHSHYPATAIAPIFLRGILRGKMRLVLSVHGEYAGNILDRITFSKYDTILAVSNFIKHHVMQKFNIPSEKIKVIHNAVNTKLFKYDEKGADEIKKRLCLHGCPVLLFVGRIVPEKGLHKLIKTLPKILLKFPSTKLLIVGPPGDFSCRKHTYFEKIISLTKALGIADSILYLGQLPCRELPSVYSVADICVVPSIWEEPFGLVVLEAMACSKPVVAFKVGGISEIITDGFNGFLIRKGDEEGLAAKIMFLLENDEVREEIGRNARATVERKFTYEKIVTKLLREIYQG